MQLLADAVWIQAALDRVYHVSLVDVDAVASSVGIVACVRGGHLVAARAPTIVRRETRPIRVHDLYGHVSAGRVADEATRTRSHWMRQRAVALEDLPRHDAIHADELLHHRARLDSESAR